MGVLLSKQQIDQEHTFSSMKMSFLPKLSPSLLPRTYDNRQHTIDYDELFDRMRRAKRFEVRIYDS